MPLIFEDSQEAIKKQIPIPSNAKKIFKAMEKEYEPYLNTNIKGAKILKSLASDKHYNKRGKNSAKNGQETKQDMVSFEDAKKRLARQDKFSPNSIQYQLYGGELAHNILKKGVEGARNVQKVDAVKPPKPNSVNNLQLPQLKQQTIKTPKGNIKYTVTAENRQMSEDYEDYQDYDYDSPINAKFEEYGVYYVLQEFLENPNGHEEWFPLIDPNMYQKALSEFMKYGKLVSFPPKHVYQWMGIILKNTAILNANNSLFGRNGSLPLEELSGFLDEWFKDGRSWDWGDGDDIVYEISVEEFKNLCKQEGLSLNEDYGLHRNGQYDLFMNQYETDQYDENQAELEANREKTQQLENLKPYIEQYNERNYHSKIILNSVKGALYRQISVDDFLDEIGFYKWCSLPDGSVGCTDFAIPKLYEILKQYTSDSTPEETLVIVNKALDVYHQQGDIASMFIVGGSKTLSQISEAMQHNPKTIYITEKQLKKLWQIQ